MLLLLRRELASVCALPVVWVLYVVIITTHGFDLGDEDSRRSVESWQDSSFYLALWNDERFRRDCHRVAASPDGIIRIYARQRS